MSTRTKAEEPAVAQVVDPQEELLSKAASFAPGLSSDEDWDALEGLLDGLSEDVEPLVPTGATSLDLIDRYQKMYFRMQDQIDALAEHADAMEKDLLAKVKDFRERVIGPVLQRQARAEQMVGSYLALSGQRRVQGVYGTAEFTPSRTDLKKAATGTKAEGKDQDKAIVTWLRKEGREGDVTTKTEESPNMKLLKKKWLADKVVPPCCEVVPVGGNLKIDRTKPQEEETDGESASS